MTILSSACETVEQKFKLRCISTEYEILLLLYELNEISSGDLLAIQHASSSTFYKCIDDLKLKGLIQVKRDADDRRHSQYSLTPFARGVLDEKWDKIQAWTRVRPRGASGESSGV
jgi:DNA-binding MarR family transcriptional regulator